MTTGTAIVLSVALLGTGYLAYRVLTRPMPAPAPAPTPTPTSPGGLTGLLTAAADLPWGTILA